VDPSAEKNKLNSLIHLPAAFLTQTDQWLFSSINHAALKTASIQSTQQPDTRITKSKHLTS